MTATAEAILALTRRCFPWLIRSDEAILGVLRAPGNHIAARWEDGALAAACVSRGETVYLLCVDEAHRGAGIGGELLADAEGWLRAHGARGVTVGVGEGYIAPGVPMIGGADAFFRRRGYRHAWGGTGCFDMECDLAAPPAFTQRIGREENGILCRLATPADREAVVDCVRDGCEAFVQYYLDDALYDPQGKTPVCMAVMDGRTAGCILLDIGTIEPDLGNVGCTVTREDCRNRGVATAMVRASTAYLRERGLRRAALQYTYTDILRMYGRAGYRVSREYFMARKEFCT